MSNFKKNKSTSKIILKNFAAALKDFIYPDSKAGKLVYMNVRGNEDAPASNDVCQTMAPQDYEDILLLGQDMEFKWGIKGEAFSFKIRNTANDQIVFNAKPQKQSITVPLSKLAPGFVYQWTVKDLKNNTGCQASFSVLSKEESNQIKTDLEQVAKLLPPDADKETKLRLQSGYLLSEGFVFDAFRLFESKGF